MKTVQIPVFEINATNMQGELATLERQLREFPKQYKAAMARVFNRAGDGARVLLGKIVREEYTLAPAKIRTAFGTRRARPAFPVFRLYVTGKRAAHITDWGAKQVKKGVAVRIKRSSGRTVIPGAFIRPGKNSDKPIAFVRTSEKRYPIKALYTTTGLDIVSRPDVQTRLKSKVDERLAMEGLRELKYRLSKLGAPSA